MAALTTKATEFEKLRPLGALEKFSSARHYLGFYHNVGISASYSSPAHASLPLKQVITAAVAATIQKHPVLSAIPMNEDSANPYFVRLPSINIEETIKFMTREKPYIKSETDIELNYILQAQHNHGFKENFGSQPFWRVIIITEPFVENHFIASFIFHHSLGDGTSGMVFHKDFLSALEGASSAMTSSIVYPFNTDLLPNFELLHEFPIPAANQQHKPKGLWSGGKITMPTSSNFHSLFISQPTTQKFVQACKTNRTTVTATIPVIIATALMNSIPTHFQELECTVPVSLRRWMPAPITEHSFGVWIDAFSQYYRRENVLTFSWDEARKSRETISDYLKSGGERINVAKFKHIKDMREFFLSKVGTERGSSFDVSNLGSMRVKDVDGMEQWKIGRVVFSRSAFVSGSAIAVGVVSGVDGCLSLGFSWQEGIVSNELIEKFVHRLYGEIEGIAKAEGPAKIE